jgi:hypothetical protein
MGRRKDRDWETEAETETQRQSHRGYGAWGKSERRELEEGATIKNNQQETNKNSWFLVVSSEKLHVFLRPLLLQHKEWLEEWSWRKELKDWGKGNSRRKEQEEGAEGRSRMRDQSRKKKQEEGAEGRTRSREQKERGEGWR